MFLAIDTSTLTLSLALYEWSGGTLHVLEQREKGPPTKVSELLPRAIFDLLQAHQLTLSGLQGIAFGIGPGSFTGLRIGLSTIKALAYAAQLPLGTASSLAALALQGEEGVPLFACEVARKGELYVGPYVREGSAVTPRGPEDTLTPPQLAALWREVPAAQVIGPGVLAQRAALEAAGIPAAQLREAPHHPSAASIARLTRVPPTFDQQALFALEPHYVRASEPERNPKFPPLPGPPAASRLRED